LLLDIYGRCRGYRNSGRVSITRSVANWRIAVGRGIGGCPVAIVAETVTQQPHS
jgi:hypothetical protein